MADARTPALDVDRATDALIDAAHDAITYLAYPDSMTITAATAIILARRLTEAIKWIDTARTQEKQA